MKKKKNWYAVYKGDTFLVQGTKEECAEYLNVEPYTICFMTTPIYLKRKEKSKTENYLIAIKVDDIEVSYETRNMYNA